MPKGNTKMPTNFIQRKTGPHQSQGRCKSLRWWECTPTALFCTQTCTCKTAPVLTAALNANDSSPQAKQVAKYFQTVTLHQGQELSSCGSLILEGELWIAKAGSEPSCLCRQLWLPHTQTSRALRSCNTAQQKKRAKLICENSSVLQALKKPLHCCCTAGVAKDCHQWGLIPRQVTKQMNFQGRCPHMPPSCARPSFSQVVKEAF